MKEEHMVKEREKEGKERWIKREEDEVNGNECK